MPAVVEDRVVRSTVQNLLIPEVDFGTFVRQICENFKDRTALVSTHYRRPLQAQPLGTRVIALRVLNSRLLTSNLRFTATRELTCVTYAC